MILGGRAESYEELYENAKSALQTPTDAQKTALSYGKLLEKPLQKTIVFECADQKTFRGIPYRFLKACYGKEVLKDYQLLWCIKKDADAGVIKAEFPDIKIIKGKGAGYKEALATAQIIITDVRLPYYYLAREEQIYIRAFEEDMYQKDMEAAVMDTLDQKRMQIKDLLNAAYILSRDSKMTEQYLKEGYQLQSVYTGKIVETGDLETMDFHTLLTKISTKQKPTDVVRCEDDKTKLVIIADYTTTQWWQDRLRRVLAHMDFEIYDVTVLTPVVRDTQALKELQSLNDNVRILMRSGHMNADIEDYLIYHCVREEYLGFANYETLTAQISKKAIDHEWKRLVGNAKFDIVITCENLTQEQMGFWHMFVRRSGIASKYMASWQNFRQEYQRMQADEKVKEAVEDYVKNCEAYDKLYLVAGSEVDEVKETWKLQMPMDVFKDELPERFSSEQESESCEYQKETYMVLDEKKENGQLTVMIIKQPDEKEYNCISNLMNYSKESLICVLNHFAEIVKAHENARLYLLDSIECMAEWSDTEIRNRRLEDQIYKIYKTDLNKEYLSQFKEYLTADSKYKMEDIYLEEAKKLGLKIVE